MKQIVLLTILFSLAFAAMAFAQKASPKAAVEDLGWMAGCWKQQRGESGYFLEQWTKPAGMMLGMAYTVRDGKVTSYEYMRLIEKDDDLFYVADPSGQKEAAFKLTSLRDGEAVFENPDHDFPQKLVYRKAGEKEMRTRVEAVQDGKIKGFDIVFAKTDCNG